uniref:NB-ARC domain-containing protein n=1 Tax=Fagus sylvatica TaxID=28930 RepID=A0A2N9G8R2_FAGSY
MALALVSGITQQLGSFITSEFKLTASVKEEIQKLESKFRTIQAVLNDAEKRQVKEEAVKLWLDKLKDVSYEMDDVLDEWNTAMIKAAIAKEEEEGEAETSTAKKRKDDLVSILLGKGSEEERSPHVISLVGMGGIGKTTLAQLAYNDPEMMCGLKTPHCGKPFKVALKNGAQGSRILVTTRKIRVAEIMGSTSARMINLEVLSEKDCWLVFSKIAFSGKDAEKCEELEVLGRQIAKKCKGLPLAAKTIGSLMRFKRSREQWENVLDSNLWELEDVEKVVEKDLFAPLLLSYYDLPSPLKQCFSYCAIFPKDYVFSSDELVEMWMAQGYINSKEDMEIIAREYFENLAIRSFFQDFEKDEDDGQIRGCKMHDIVHDFAQTDGVYGFGRLTSLRRLSHFYVSGTKDGCKLGELKDLNQLEGSLDIEGLGNVVDVCEAENAQLKKKIHLHTLKLQFTGGYYRGYDRRIEHNVSVLNALESPPNLKYLSIKWYKGTTMSPNWTMSLTKLKILYLNEFKNLEHLPPLGKLPVLESLIIESFESLRKVGVEFLGIESQNKKEHNMQIFPNLKYLKFKDLEVWEEWIGIGGKREEEEDSNITIMPRLQRLVILDCPELNSLPDFLRTIPLKELEINSFCRTKEGQGRSGTRFPISQTSRLKRSMYKETFSWFESDEEEHTEEESDEEEHMEEESDEEKPIGEAVTSKDAPQIDMFSGAR